MMRNHDNSSELSGGFNESQHSASSSRLRNKKLINDENKRIDHLIASGSRSVSQVRLGARSTESQLIKRDKQASKINNYVYGYLSSRSSSKPPLAGRSNSQLGLKYQSLSRR